MDNPGSGVLHPALCTTCQLCGTIARQSSKQPGSQAGRQHHSCLAEHCQIFDSKQPSEGRHVCNRLRVIHLRGAQISTLVNNSQCKHRHSKVKPVSDYGGSHLRQLATTKADCNMAAEAHWRLVRPCSTQWGLIQPGNGVKPFTLYFSAKLQACVCMQAGTKSTAEISGITLWSQHATMCVYRLGQRAQQQLAVLSYNMYQCAGWCKEHSSNQRHHASAYNM